MSRLRKRRSRCLTIPFLLFSFALTSAHAATPAQIKTDVTVGPANDPVHLKAGQIVQVMSSGPAQSVIMVPLPDGSQGVYQVDSAALESPTAASSSTPPAATVPATPPTPEATAAPPPVAATPPTAPPPPVVHQVVGDPNFPEDKSTLVHVHWPTTGPIPPPYGSIYSSKAGAYTYKVYLPPGYYEHPDFKYPTLFIMSPGGHAKLGSFEVRVKQEGWIAIMFGEARDGPWGPIFGNMLASYQDAIGRFRICDGARYGTGFSGGARGTSLLTQIIPGFAGEYLQGAGFAFEGASVYDVEGVPHDGHYAVFMTIGTKDRNFVELGRMENLFSGIPFKSETFNGKHEPSPPDMVNDALDWLLDQTLSQGDLSDDLRSVGIRHFDYLARTLASASGNARKEKLEALVKLGGNLNLLPGSPEAVQLQNFQTAEQNGG
jgi:hypothetical protein